MVLDVIVSGLVGGLIATASMTLSQHIEILFTRREPSITPLLIVSRLFKFKIDRYSEKERLRLSNLVHWGYGIIWGVPLALLLYLLEFSFEATVGILFLVFWAQGFSVGSISQVVPPIWTWERKWLFLDPWHHFVYSIALAVFYYYFVR